MTEPRLGLREERGPVLFALMMSMGLIAIDSTILATAVPSVVGDLGGFEEFPWLFSVYTLAQAVSVPIYGKLADTLGRKPIMLVGIGTFLLGSILCALAPSLLLLIIFRVVQGLGAGAIAPMVMTISSDIYSVRERAKIQGYIASVWGISAVVGPTLGGVFAQLDAWRLIFWINVPLCVLAGVLIWRGFHEQREATRSRIDLLGAVLLTSGSTLLILGALEGGQAWRWASWPSVLCFALGVVLIAAFVLVERRAAEPILPLWVFSRRLLVTTNLIALGLGAALIGLTTYVPTYLQNTIGTTPIVAGLALAALTLGWPIAAGFSGRLYLRWGFRWCVIVGCVLSTVGAVALALGAGSPSVWFVGVTCFVVGLGFGLIASPSLIAAQSRTSWRERGVVTGANMFGRSLGSALGVAALGAVANGVLRGRSEFDVAAMTSAASAVFWVCAALAVAMALGALFMPDVRVDRDAVE